MAMLGSVVTADMLPNHIYGGAPAKDLTEKLGPQFLPRSLDEKIAAAITMIVKYEADNPEYAGRILAVDILPVKQCSDTTYLDLSTRTYTRRYSKAEVAFFKANVPLIKLTPAGEPPLF